MKKQPYWQQLKDPRWQRRRLEILNRAGFKCEECADAENPLQVHHRYYERGKAPWEYDDGALVCLCESCHEYVAEMERLFLSSLPPKCADYLLQLAEAFGEHGENFKREMDRLFEPPEWSFETTNVYAALGDFGGRFCNEAITEKLHRDGAPIKATGDNAEAAKIIAL